jgi:hypothetical protein
MDAGTLDSGESTDVRAAAEFLEDGEEDAGGSAEYPEHMTPEDITGVPASGTSGTGPGSTAYGRE